MSFESKRPPKYIYYDLHARSNETSDLDNDPRCNTNDDRSTKLLDDTRKYDCSIVRFSVNSPQTIPMFIPTIELKQASPTKTVYYVSMSVQASQENSATVYTSQLSKVVTFVPEFPNDKVSAPTSSQDLSSRYYHVHDISTVISMFNQALSDLHDDIKADLDTKAGGAVTQWYEAPYIIFDKSTKRMTFYMDNTAFGHDDLVFNTGGGSSYQYKSQLYFDSNSWGLIFNLPHTKMGNDVTNTVGLPYFTYKLLPKDDLGTNIYTYNTVNYIKMEQSEASLSHWGPISSIVFTSTQLGAEPQRIGAFREFLDGDRVKVSSQSNKLRIISDLELPVFSSDQWKQAIFYQPSKYRMMSITNSDGNLRHLDIQVNLRYRLDGVIRPLKLYNQGDFSIKLLFQRKEGVDDWEEDESEN